MDFKIKETKDLLKLLIFFVVSPIIGIVMFFGMVGTSLGLLFVYFREMIINRKNK